MCMQMFIECVSVCLCGCISGLAHISRVSQEVFMNVHKLPETLVVPCLGGEQLMPYGCTMVL